jgi:hypothetical protein
MRVFDSAAAHETKGKGSRLRLERGPEDSTTGLCSCARTPQSVRLLPAHGEC